MAALFSFEVHTPYRLFYSGRIEALILTLADGEICVYANHSFFTSPVRTGVLTIRDGEGKLRTAFTSEGILEVKSHKTVLMADSAEWPGEIDGERALAAKKRALETLETAMLKFETDNAKASLARAETRLKVRETAPPPSA
ncbi:MAG: ATP synthase F1 subunit epsilon [Treponema sp.]|jgi:F-type H+-transporting ATPase subunit epsilon|nr:ATP synthase F1 subunit epsilon [Treponema sp.]